MYATDDFNIDVEPPHPDDAAAALLWIAIIVGIIVVITS